MGFRDQNNKVAPIDDGGSFDTDTSVNSVTATSEAGASALAAANSAAAALVSENAASADLALTNADVVLTHADVVTTNADVVTTTADVVTTAADRVQTGLDRADVAANLVLTNQDTLDTAADLALTNADVVTTNADVVLTNADVVTTNADVVLATTARNEAVAAKNAIDGLYLGVQASDPSVDGLGNALTAGDWYFNSTNDVVRIYRSSAWVNGSVDGTLYATATQGVTADAALPKAGGTMTGDLTVPNVIVSGNVDGRDISTDGTKLDGIEVGATADQTAIQIKTAYESNSNTNEFSDAEQTKLAGIATGADVSSTAVTQSFVNNLNVDAETLDGDTKTVILSAAESTTLALAIALG
jgi:hypothetical protein